MKRLSKFCMYRALRLCDWYKHYIMLNSINYWTRSWFHKASINTIIYYNMFIEIQIKWSLIDVVNKQQIKKISHSNVSVSIEPRNVPCPLMRLSNLTWRHSGQRELWDCAGWSPGTLAAYDIRSMFACLRSIDKIDS